MSARLRLARMLTASDEWNRRRLQALIVLAVVVLTAVVGGLVWSIVVLVRVGPAPGTADRRAVGGEPDPGAARPAPLDQAQPGPLSAGSAGTFRIPAPDSLGDAQVATGFPDSTPGALAQLIAIDRRALESASVPITQHVISAWATPGGPSPQNWTGVAAVRLLLESAAQPADGSTDLTVRLYPTMGLIRDGSPTVCVDFILTVTVSGGQPNRVAVADCQHMTWLSGRWLIGAGPEAAPSPSVWPGTQASYDAGYRWLAVKS